MWYEGQGLVRSGGWVMEVWGCDGESDGIMWETGWDGRWYGRE